MSEAEANYLRKQAKRRLWCSVAMVLLAVLLTGAMIFLEAPAQRLADQADQLPDQEFTENQKSFARFYTWYWITFFLVLLSMLIMAGIDVVATRRYAKEQYQRIQRERRALIEQEAAHIRNRTTRL